MKIDNTLNNSFYSIAQFVINSVALIILYYVIILKIGQEQLGLWSIITAVPTAVSVFGSGVSGCMLRYTPVFKVKAQTTRFSQMLASGVLFNLVIATLILVVCYLFSAPILNLLLSHKTSVIKYIPVFRLAFWVFFINFISSVFLSSLDGMLKIKVRSIINSSASILLCLLAYPFISIWGIAGILYLQLIQSLWILILSCFQVIRSEMFELRSVSLSFADFKTFIFQGSKFQTISLSILFFEPVTKYFLNKYFNLNLVGVYDICNRAATQIRNIINAGIQVIVPRVTELKELEKIDLKSYFIKALRLAILVSCVAYALMIISMVYGSQLLQNKNHSVFVLFLISLSFAYLINTISITAYSVLLGLGELKIIVNSHLISTILNIILYFLLKGYQNQFVMILPPFISVIISSIYLLLHFLKKFKISILEALDEIKIFIGLLILFLIILFYHIIYNNSLLNLPISLLFILLVLIAYHNKTIDELKQKIGLKKSN